MDTGVGNGGAGTVHGGGRTQHGRQVEAKKTRHRSSSVIESNGRQPRKAVYHDVPTIKVYNETSCIRHFVHRNGPLTTKSRRLPETYHMLLLLLLCDGGSSTSKRLREALMADGKKTRRAKYKQKEPKIPTTVTVYYNLCLIRG